MNTRNLVYFFTTTFLWGGSAGLIIGLLLSIMDPALAEWSVGDWTLGLIGWIGGGLLFSAVSMFGFFAYSLLNQLGLGVFRGPRGWNSVLGLLIIISFFASIYLPYDAFFTEGRSILSFIIFPVVLFIWGLIVSNKKSKETNKYAFMPTLFFMFSFTLIELIPALRADNLKSLLDMATPLIVANTWQVLILHKLIVDKKKGQAQKVKSS